MASIRKLPNGTFQATIYLGRDANNKQIRKYITRKTEKEARSVARQIEQEYEDGLFLNIPNMKFSTWADKYLEIREKHLSPTTYIYYKACINNHFKPYFGKLKLNQINDIHISQYIAIKLKEGLSKATVRKHFVILSNMFKMALKKKNPCDLVEAPSGKSNARYVPTTEEFERLLSAVEGLWDELPILLAAWCGMREGEIFCLKVNDILDDKIRIDENRALSESGNEDDGPKYKYIDKEPKSDNGYRIITVPDYVMSLLKKRIQSLNLKNDDYIFNMRPDSYGKRFAKIIKYHNMMLENPPKGKKASFAKDTLPLQLKIQDKPIPKFTFHALRHYHATVLYEQSIPDQYAAERLGHDVMVLKKIYQRLQLDKKTKLDEKIKDIFKKPE